MKKTAFFEAQDLENRAAQPHQEFPGVPPGSNHCYVKSKRVRPRSAKELITRNESREVGLYYQDKLNIKGTKDKCLFKKNEQGIVYLLAVFSIHIVLTDVHDTGRKAVIKRKQRMFIIT